MAALILGTSVGAPATAAHQAIDTQQSTVTVRVFKSGLLRGLADNHEIRGMVKSGFIRNTMPIEARIVVDARDLRVLDPDVSAKDREQVQARMLGPEVLDANRFPEIRFESGAVERAPSGDWIVHGQLTLHGQTHPLTTTVVEDHGHFKGTMTLKQSDYGIAPISIAGGTVKVKDELKIDFNIVAKSSTPTTEP